MGYLRLCGGCHRDFTVNSLPPGGSATTFFCGKCKPAHTAPAPEFKPGTPVYCPRIAVTPDGITRILPPARNGGEFGQVYFVAGPDADGWSQVQTWKNKPIHKVKHHELTRASTL